MENIVGGFSSSFGKIFSPFLLSTSIRAFRFKFLYKSPIIPMKSLTKIVENKPFTTDIEKGILDPNCGVKVLWAPEGSGKTTHVRLITNKLIQNNKLEGAIIIKATETDFTPLAWFSSSIKDLFYPVPIVLDASSINDLLENINSPQGILSPKRILIVIDQLENIRRTDKLNRLIKSLAEESVLSKKFTVLVITKDPAYARGLLELNGRTKIRPICKDDLQKYKWNEHQITQWIEFNGKENIKRIEALKAAGTLAGTPGFLIDNSDETNDDIISKAGSYGQSLWELGTKLFHFP